jgi:hypothetical protein
VIEQQLNADTLPLVLLAALGHPDSALRNRLLQRLDLAIEARQPLHSEQRARIFLTSQPGSDFEPFYLDRMALEAGVRVIRLLFTRKTRRVSKRMLRIVSCAALDERGGLVVNQDLKSLYLEHSLPRPKNCESQRRQRRMEQPEYHGCLVHKARRRFQKGLHHSAVLVSGGISQRLGQLWMGRRAIQAECQVEGGFRLQLRGDLPWPLEPRTCQRLDAGSTLGTHQGLTALGLAAKTEPEELSLHTTSPEAVIRFSACLARGERLVLRDSRDGSAGRIVILLHDFDGERTRFPAVVGYSGAETWLRSLPEIALPVTDDERLAIARWAYPPDVWLTNELLEKLV